MKTLHTPGPWVAEKPTMSGRSIVYIKIAAGKKAISSTSVYAKKKDGTDVGKKYKDRFGIEHVKESVVEDECLANARLIAAAPELLEAAIGLTESIAAHSLTCRLSDAIKADQKAMLAAIAKARSAS